MTIRKDSKRYKNNVGGAKFLQENKDRAERMELRQFRYIRFIDQSWRKKCLLKRMPYPKYYNEETSEKLIATDSDRKEVQSSKINNPKRTLRLINRRKTQKLKTKNV